jgi:predicted dehydrogenase
LAEHKIHILTETPIALTVPCANAMIEVARDNGVLLEVSENVRRWPHERLKRKIVESGLIGDIREFYLSYTSGSYHGMSGIRAILGTEAMSVTGEYPGEEKVGERGFIEWSGGIKGTYEYNTDRKNYWEITGSKGAIRGRQLHLYEGDRDFDIVTETVGEGAGKTVRRAYVGTGPEVSWESHLQNYPLSEADQVAVADAWCSLYEAVVRGEELDYGAENGKWDVELLMGIRGSATAGGKKVILPLKEITEYERRVHSEFEKVYGVDILDLASQHLRRKYDLPGRLKELMFYGRTLEE